MILVTGATGTIGSSLVYILAHAGVQFRAMVRNPDHIPDPIRELEVELVTGDFEDPATLVNALKGVKKAFLVSPGDWDVVRLQGNFIDAAKRAGVDYIVKISTIGAAPDALYSLGRRHFEIEQQIESERIPYTHLRPHSFMQNFFLQAQFIQAEGAFMAPMGEGKIPMVDARDVATVAATVLTTEDHEGMIYELTGPETLSYDDAAEKISDLVGRTVKFIDIPLDQTRKSLIDNGWQDWMADDLVSLYRFFREGHASQVTDSIESILGRPAVSFERFLKDYALVFKALAKPGTTQ